MEIESQFIEVEESAHPVIVDRIDDKDGSFVSLSRNFDEEWPESEHLLLSFTLQNARLLGEALIRATAPD